MISTFKRLGDDFVRKNKQQKTGEIKKLLTRKHELSSYICNYAVPVIWIPETLPGNPGFLYFLGNHGRKPKILFCVLIFVGNPGILYFLGKLGRKPGNVKFSDDLSHQEDREL